MQAKQIKCIYTFISVQKNIMNYSLMCLALFIRDTGQLVLYLPLQISAGSHAAKCVLIFDPAA